MSQDEIERIPEGEAEMIRKLVQLTEGQMRAKFPGVKPMLRNVHPKSHGCVRATFRVADDVPKDLQVGIFAAPGRKYDAWMRFSNADPTGGPDSTFPDGKLTHGSRGLGIKLLGVCGEPLTPLHGPPTQDFLMIHRPVFTFANVEDYLVITEVLSDPKPELRDPKRFFALQFAKAEPAPTRARRTLELLQASQATAVRNPAASDYFGAAPFLYGERGVMKFRVKHSEPEPVEPDWTDPNYLQKALAARLAPADAPAVRFTFEVQVRKFDQLGAIETEIEDACTDWTTPAFVPVASIEILPQVVPDPATDPHCERLVFTPWHGIREHRPLGGINRLRLAVYEASAKLRHLAKEPS